MQTRPKSFWSAPEAKQALRAARRCRAQSTRQWPTVQSLSPQPATRAASSESVHPRTAITSSRSPRTRSMAKMPPTRTSMRWGTQVTISAAGGGSPVHSVQPSARHQELTIRLGMAITSGRPPPAAPALRRFLLPTRGRFGTSPAAAQVAGCGRLIKSAVPAATPAQIKSAIVTSARPFPGSELVRSGPRVCRSLRRRHAGRYARFAGGWTSRRCHSPGEL